MNKKIADEINDLTNNFFQKYKNLDDKLTTIQISNDKWSLKQIIGHLIDSASNNHQRFIRFQIDKDLNFPDYNRDEWLNTFNYNKMVFTDLISLLKYYNILISKITETVNKSSLSKRWNIKWSEAKNYITFKELIEHYLTHLKGHFKHFEERLVEIKNGNFL